MHTPPRAEPRSVRNGRVRHPEHSGPGGDEGDKTLTSALLGVDIGTTHCKAGTFDLAGEVICLASHPTPSHHTADGHPCYDPEALWEAVIAVIQEVLSAAAELSVEVVGIAGMAEAGLLVDAASGAPRTEIIPWFDPRSTEQMEIIERESDPWSLFRRSGLRPSFKYGLSKILWLRQMNPAITGGAIWLSVPDYVMYRLTGRMATDPTLAARTYVYDLTAGSWDAAWIRHFDLDPAVFPEVHPSGSCAGNVTALAAQATGLTMGTPVALSGHDHICTLLAAGITAPGPVLDSIGTAESVLGVLDRLTLDHAAFESGMTIAPHVLGGLWCWLGGTPAAGGSVEWLRAQLGEEPLSYDQLDYLLKEVDLEPGDVLYVPYLAGSGAPVHNLHVRAAFAGLSASHGRADLVKAVLEGTAYEFESIRRAAEGLTGVPIREVLIVGGGARNSRWVQIRADVSNCTCRTLSLSDATTLGAALTAALGCGLLDNLASVTEIASRYQGDYRTFTPEPGRHRRYHHLYETQYEPFQAFLRGKIEKKY